MKKAHSLPALLVIAALLDACSSAPMQSSLLEQTRSDYQIAQGNPQVATYAALEMNQATLAMERANLAANEQQSAEDIDKLAYLATQKIALAQEVAKQKSAEADVKQSGQKRDQIRLEQRTAEADQAKRAAQLAQNDAAQAQRATQAAQTHATMLEAQLAELAAQQTARGVVITLGDVLFATDQAQLNAEGLRKAQKLADVLQQNLQRTVLIEGFADSTGSSEHNQQLSERRASAVGNTLQTMGVARERIAVSAFGEAYPVASNDNDAGRQLNRRVEIVLSGDNGRIGQR